MPLTNSSLLSMTFESFSKSIPRSPKEQKSEKNTIVDCRMNRPIYEQIHTIWPSTENVEIELRLVENTVSQGVRRETFFSIISMLESAEKWDRESTEEDKHTFLPHDIRQEESTHSILWLRKRLCEKVQLMVDMEKIESCMHAQHPISSSSDMGIRTGIHFVVTTKEETILHSLQDTIPSSEFPLRPKWVRLRRRRTFLHDGYSYDCTIVWSGPSLCEAQHTSPTYEIEIECICPFKQKDTLYAMGILVERGIDLLGRLPNSSLPTLPLILSTNHTRHVV
jgi:hypothetical protein